MHSIVHNFVFYVKSPVNLGFIKILRFGARAGFYLNKAYFCYNFLISHKLIFPLATITKQKVWQWRTMFPQRGYKYVRHVSELCKPWRWEESREKREGPLTRKGGRKIKPPGRPSLVSNWGQSHQTGLPRFQSLLTFVNHQPVSLHRGALPAVTPSTQTGWQQLLCLKEGLWISQH